MTKQLIVRTHIQLKPDASRVLIRPFIPSDNRVIKIMARVASQSDTAVKEHLDKILKDFADRHIAVKETFLRRYKSVKHLQFVDLEPSYERKLLIGSYFTSEYSLESAALFNPSIVPHPDQDDLPDGSMRFIISLRAVGEGHISSVAFRCGVIDANNNIKIENPTSFVETPTPVINKEFKNSVLSQKFMDMGYRNEYSNRVFNMLPELFTFKDLKTVISDFKHRESEIFRDNAVTNENLLWIARANYDVEFTDDIPIGGRSLFPNSPSEKHGIEDARFVKFKSTNGDTRYYATTTAWDGKNILSQIIETHDFKAFKVRTLNGEAVQNKGMALFPRKIKGKYVMLSRQDNENIYLMYSHKVQFWRESKIIIKPAYPWEFYQMGNSGSPLETSEGWLVITHGVGAMRRYAIGAVLLDLDDPSKVIGRTKKPFLVPNENEREGYVPNVVYSCGSMIHNGQLILPYAMSDYASRIALVDIDMLLKKLKEK